MKKMLAMLVLLCSLFITSSALATWNCHASSNWGGEGAGFSDSRYIAVTIAMRECWHNTPYWDYCYLRTCYWYWY